MLYVQFQTGSFLRLSASMILFRSCHQSLRRKEVLSCLASNNEVVIDRFFFRFKGLFKDLIWFDRNRDTRTQEGHISHYGLTGLSLGPPSPLKPWRRRKKTPKHRGKNRKKNRKINGSSTKTKSSPADGREPRKISRNLSWPRRPEEDDDDDGRGGDGVPRTGPPLPAPPRTAPPPPGRGAACWEGAPRRTPSAPPLLLRRRRGPRAAAARSCAGGHIQWVVIPHSLLVRVIPSCLFAASASRFGRILARRFGNEWYNSFRHRDTESLDYCDGWIRGYLRLGNINRLFFYGISVQCDASVAWCDLAKRQFRLQYFSFAWFVYFAYIIL